MRMSSIVKEELVGSSENNVPNKMCSTSGKVIAVVKATRWQDKHMDGIPGWFISLPPKVKRIRITCPTCKRRVLSSVEADNDGGYIYHRLPPHKVRYWWKIKGG